LGVPLEAAVGRLKWEEGRASKTEGAKNFACWGKKRQLCDSMGGGGWGEKIGGELKGAKKTIPLNVIRGSKKKERLTFER